MNEPHIYDRIEAYLLNQMSPKERQELEKELKSNEALADQFRRQEMEHKIMEQLVAGSLLSEMEKWHKEGDIENNGNPSSSRAPLYRHPFFWIAISAAVLLLVFFAIWLNSSNQQNQSPVAKEGQKEIPEANLPLEEQSTKDIIGKEEVPPSKNEQENVRKEEESKSAPQHKKNPQDQTSSSPKSQYIALAEPYINEVQFPNIRGQVRGAADSFDEAIIDFNENDFEAGIQKLNAILNESPNDQKVHYYIALAYFEQKDYAKALPHLKFVAESTYLYTEKAQWLLALTNLATEQPQKSIEVLSKIIVDKDHPSYQSAKELLGKITE